MPNAGGDALAGRYRTNMMGRNAESPQQMPPTFRPMFSNCQIENAPASTPSNSVSNVACLAEDAGSSNAAGSQCSTGSSSNGSSGGGNGGNASTSPPPMPLLVASPVKLQQQQKGTAAAVTPLTVNAVASVGLATHV